ncbi:MAG TPA: helix-turn-helix domain-containing protein [Thermoleophilaceae bacterium]
MSTHLTSEHSPPGVLTVDQVAARFQLSAKTIYRALERGQLRAAKFGSAWRIREADADAWFDGNVPERVARATPVRRRGASPRPGGLRALEAS